jgi:hypothetical protein
VIRHPFTAIHSTTSSRHVNTPTDRCHELITSGPLPRLAFVIERSHGHRNVRAQQPGTHARPAMRGLPDQECRRRSSAHIGAGGGDLARQKDRCTPGTHGRQCIATAPLPGAPFACPDTSGRRDRHAMKLPRCARPSPARPALAGRIPMGRGGVWRSCAGRAIALNWWRTHGTHEAWRAAAFGCHQAQTRGSR